MSSPRVSLSDLAIFGVLGAVWGGAFLFLRIASPQVGPLWAAEARIGLAALVLIALFGRRAWPTIRARLVPFTVVGITFSAIPFSLIAFGSVTLPTGVGALLNAATPIFTALVSAAWIGQKITGRAALGMGIGVAAVLVLVGWSPLPPGPGTILAVAAVLGATLSYAVAGTYIRRSLHDVPGVELATGQLAIGALVLLPVALLSGPPGVPSVDGVAALVAAAVVSTALAWPLYFRVLSHTTPMAASTVTFIVPAFGMLWGALALSEPIGPGLVAGFGLVIVSLFLVLGLPFPSIASTRARLATAFGRGVVATPTPA
jgi:drug/metabolite transporter (DMT)-like permease